MLPHHYSSVWSPFGLSNMHLMIVRVFYAGVSSTHDVTLSPFLPPLPHPSSHHTTIMFSDIDDSLFNDPSLLQFCQQPTTTTSLKSHDRIQQPQSHSQSSWNQSNGDSRSTSSTTSTRPVTSSYHTNSNSHINPNPNTNINMNPSHHMDLFNDDLDAHFYSGGGKEYSPQKYASRQGQGQTNINTNTNSSQNPFAIAARLQVKSSSHTNTTCIG